MSKSDNKPPVTPLVDYIEGPNASLSSDQIKILRGRKLADLTPIERLAYANAAPKPVVKKGEVPPAFKRKIDQEKVSKIDVYRRLEIVNDLTEYERALYRRHQLNEELARETDPMRQASMAEMIRKLNVLLTSLFQRIKNFLLPLEEPVAAG